MLDSFHEECGVVGVYGHTEAANLVYLSLYALQHRGQESAGIVSTDGKVLLSHRGMGLVALSHNGNLTNYVELRRRLEADGRIFQSGSDSEVILHLNAMSKAARLVDRIVDALREVRGAYSLVFLSEPEMIAARDANGFR